MDDIRHDPSANDKMMYDWILQKGFEPEIIATKSDKLKRRQVQKHVKAIQTCLNLNAQERIFTFSSETKQGREELWDYMDMLAGVAKVNGNKK